MSRTLRVGNNRAAFAAQGRDSRRMTTSCRRFSPSSDSSLFLGYSGIASSVLAQLRVVFDVLSLSYHRVFAFGAVALLKTRDARTSLVCRARRRFAVREKC